MAMAASLWGVTAGLRSGGDDDSNSPVVQHFEWSQICQRWAINTIIAVIVLTLLTLLVTYFGHTFSLENNRMYFIVLLVSLFAIAFIISALFCTNRRKTPSYHKKSTDTTAPAANEPLAEGVGRDMNSGGSAVKGVAIDL
jgi:hypothetical protein